MRRMLAFSGLALAAATAAGIWYWQWAPSAPEASYRLARVDRGNIVALVNATGTINPTTTVIVGSVLSGQVVELLADYNSVVTAGQVVARLNSDQVRARLDAARADLAQVRANKLVQEAQIDRVRADIEKGIAAQADTEAQIARAEALLSDAEANFRRQANLRAQGYGVTAEATYDTARAQRDAQLAAVNSSRAMLASARAQVAGLNADLRIAEAQVAVAAAQIVQREAVVRQIEADLRNTDIRSPVSGIVIQRNVELGQTVAASLQSPTLFLIADDLAKMEIAANIDETDVGRVRPGQSVSFTVNAYPGRTFTGTVKQVRLGSQIVQNVVIYTAIIAVENRRQDLMPGMTASLRIETDRRDDVLRVPNAALRWRPPAATAEAPRPAETGAPRSGARGAGQGAASLAEFVNAIKSELALNASQVQEIDAALTEAQASMAGMRQNEAPDGAALRERVAQVRSALLARIGAVLATEQRAELEEIRSRFDVARSGGQAGRVFVFGPDGKPQAVSVRLGASDGVVTEVLPGPLQADREIIIGGGPASDTPRTTFGPGPRFGL